MQKAQDENLSSDFTVYNLGMRVAGRELESVCTYIKPANCKSLVSVTKGIYWLSNSVGCLTMFTDRFL